MVAGRESVGVHPALDSKLVIDEISERLTANEREWTRRRGETKQNKSKPQMNPPPLRYGATGS